jgi:hypothetical protein
MYHIVDTILSMDPEKNEIAIVDVFEEFIGCAVSDLIASLTRTFYFLSLLLLSNIGHVSKSNSTRILL